MADSKAPKRTTDDADTPTAASIVTDINDILARKRAPEVQVPVVMDGTLANAIRQAEVELSQAVLDDQNSNKPDRAPKLRQTLLDLLDQAQHVTVTFTFRSIGRSAYTDLIRKHKPTTQQVNEAKKDRGAKPDWNPDTFPVAIIAASCVNPPMTPDQAQELWDSPSFSDAECLELFRGAIRANSETPDIPFTRIGSGVTPTSG